MRPNLRKVAQLAGVSLSTASRALRGLPRIDPATRQRVCEVAREIGYVRDPVFSNAMAFARRSEKPVFRETLAFLAQDLPANFASVVWLKRIYDGARARAAELGYAVEDVRIPQTAQLQRAMSRQLFSRGIRGLIITPVLTWSCTGLDISWEQFATVAIGRFFTTLRQPRIERDFIEDYLAMFNELYARGYRRIGFAVGENREFRRRWSLLSQYLLFLHKNPKLPKLLPFESKFTANEKDFMKWFRKEKMDVVVSSGNGPLDWLLKAGIDVPGQVGVCRIDCIHGRDESGLGVDYEAMGALAVSSLVARLERNELGIPDLPMVISIGNKWVEGTSLRPPAHKLNQPLAPL